MLPFDGCFDSRPPLRFSITASILHFSRLKPLKTFEVLLTSLVWLFVGLVSAFQPRLQRLSNPCRISPIRHFHKFIFSSLTRIRIRILLSSLNQNSFSLLKFFLQKRSIQFQPQLFQHLSFYRNIFSSVCMPHLESPPPEKPTIHFIFFGN